MAVDLEPSVPREQTARCLKYIQRWREHLARTWIGHVSGSPDTRAIGKAVDELISLALLVEKARRISSESVPALRGVVASSAWRSVQDLWASVGHSASSRILGGRLPDRRC